MKKGVEFRYIVIGLLALIVLVLVIMIVSKTSGYVFPKIIDIGNDTGERADETIDQIRNLG